MTMSPDQPGADVFLSGVVQEPLCIAPRLKPAPTQLATHVRPAKTKSTRCMLWSSSTPTAGDPPCIRSHGVGWQDPAPLTQLISQVKLSVLASFLLAIFVHSLGQAEGHQGQGIVLAQNPEVPCGPAISLVTWCWCVRLLESFGSCMCLQYTHEPCCKDGIVSYNMHSIRYCMHRCTLCKKIYRDYAVCWACTK